MTPFERKLSELPLHSIPQQWKQDILSQAKERNHPAPFPSLFSGWRNLLYPSPYAWGAIAAIWVIIFALCYSGPRGTELLASPSSPRLTDTELAAHTAALHAHYRLLAYWMNKQEFFLPSSKL